MLFKNWKLGLLQWKSEWLPTPTSSSVHHWSVQANISKLRTTTKARSYFTDLSNISLKKRIFNVSIDQLSHRLLRTIVMSFFVIDSCPAASILDLKAEQNWLWSIALDMPWRHCPPVSNMRIELRCFTIMTMTYISLHENPFVPSPQALYYSVLGHYHWLLFDLSILVFSFYTRYTWTEGVALYENVQEMSGFGIFPLETDLFVHYRDVEL